MDPITQSVFTFHRHNGMIVYWIIASGITALILTAYVTRFVVDQVRIDRRHGDRPCGPLSVLATLLALIIVAIPIAAIYGMLHNGPFSITNLHDNRAQLAHAIEQRFNAQVTDLPLINDNGSNTTATMTLSMSGNEWNCTYHLRSVTGNYHDADFTGYITCDHDPASILVPHK